jgi:crotonobetainyl-CoA:carnitine CoA-transferase CaiB-like acyl-CoA transferase
MVLFDGQTAELQPPPLAGQHNREILRGAGVSDTEIQDLMNDRVIWEETR